MTTADLSPTPPTSSEDLSVKDGSTAKQADKETDLSQRKLPALPRYTLDPITSQKVAFFLKQKEPKLFVQAFWCASQSQVAHEKGDLHSAHQYAFAALFCESKCLKCSIATLFYMRGFVDPDTITCGYRELIFAIRQPYQKYFAGVQSSTLNCNHIRPYIGDLAAMASAARKADRLDLATLTYEELIRLDHSDMAQARSILIVCYLKLIGRANQVPSNKPFRTLQHLQQLLEARFDDQPLFMGDNQEPMKRWAKIFIAWRSKKAWSQLVSAEWKKSNVFVQVVTGQQNVDSLRHDNAQPFASDNPIDQACRFAPLIREAISDWPDLQIALCKIVSRWDAGLAQSVGNEAVVPGPGQHGGKTVIKSALEAGEELLKNGEWFEALHKFTEARGPVTKPEWYEDANYAIISKRVLCARMLGHWELARIDSRFALTMKPDDLSTYQRIEKIVTCLYCASLVDRVANLLKEVQADGKRSADEWLRFARLGIALLSMSTIMTARKGELTDEFLNEMIEIGIQDMFSPIAVDLAGSSVLPWLIEPVGKFQTTDEPIHT
jgi:hypothetical protein